MKHPKVEEAMARVLTAARRHGKAAGRLATSAEEIRSCVDQGFQLIQVGTELNFMAAGARQLLEPLDRSPERRTTGPGY
jgi:2-keto-3-deoxy-L-rhamnonate aldolase RhmA